MSKVQTTLSLLCLSLLLLPAMAMAMPVSVETAADETEGWWVETTVDRDANGIGDMVETPQRQPSLLG